MDERKTPGTWVEPKFDPEQTEYPPAVAPNTGAGAGSAAARTERGVVPRLDGTMLAPTGPLVAPDQRTVDQDATGATRAEGGHVAGVTHDLPREYEGDDTRPD